MDDVHVAALVSWSLAVLAVESRQTDTESPGQRSSFLKDLRSPYERHERLLRHLRERFWPSDYLMLLYLRRYMGERTAEKDLKDLINMWLKRDPTAYWPLSLVGQKFKDNDGSPICLFEDDEREQILRRALASSQPRPTLRNWIQDELKELSHVAETVDLSARMKASS